LNNIHIGNNELAAIAIVVIGVLVGLGKISSGDFIDLVKTILIFLSGGLAAYTIIKTREK